MFFSMQHRKLKNMGFVADQQGIMARYMRERNTWQEHLQNSKDFILQFISSQTRGDVAILGSGWLLDVPVDFLQQACNRIILVDIVHPPQIRRKYAGCKNIEFVECDISGMLDVIYDLTRSKNKGNYAQIFQSEPKCFTEIIKADFYVSLNLLNQLDILLVDYLRSKGFCDSGFEMQLRKKIQSAHISMLPVGKSCLIADFEEIVFSSQGQVELVKQNVFVELPRHSANRQWVWKFDQGYYHPGKNTQFKVQACVV
jgi:hypothetical protein